MNKQSWYKGKLSDMDVVRISESDDFVVDYDKERGMYRVSTFKDNHFKDEYWFDAYEEKEIKDKSNWKFINIKGFDVQLVPFKEMLIKFRDNKIAVGYIDKTGQWYVNVGEGCSAQLFMDLYPIAVKELDR